MLRKRVLGWRLPVAGVLAATALVMVPSPAQAYQVSVLVDGAGRIVETTDASLMDCTTPYSSATSTCVAGTPSGDYGWGWVVEYQATARPGYAFVRWESTDSDPVICDGANGSTTYSAATCRFVTFANLNVRAVFSDTTAPQAPSLVGGPAGVTNQTTATFSFSHGGDPTADRFEGRLDRPGQAGTWHTVGAVGSDMSESFSGLTANGQYTFHVRTRDYAGNVSASNSRTWQVDTVAPPVPVMTSPANGTVTNAANLTLAGSVGGDAVGVEVRENGIVVGGMSTSGSWMFPRVNPPEGTHSYQARARDSAGNWSAPSSAVTVEVDRTAPLTIVTGPADGAYDRDGTVVLTGTSEPGAEVTATMGTSTVEGVTDPGGTWSLTLPGQSDGTHSYQVLGTDDAGNVFTTPARSIVVDTIAPRARAVSPRPGANRVGRKANVVVQLTERVRPGSINNRTVYLKRKGTSKHVRARLTWNATRNRIVLNPTKRLDGRRVYVVKVTRGVKDIAGHRLVRGLSWEFRTRR